MKIVQGEVLKTVRFVLEGEITVPESELPKLIDEAFNDGQTHTLQELGAQLKQLMLDDFMTPEAQAVGAKLSVDKLDLTEQP